MKAVLKFLGALAGYGVLFLIFRSLDIDFSNITVEEFRAKVVSFGWMGPVIYVVFYILRPLILLPAVVVSLAAGAIWGLKGFWILQVAANLTAIIEFLLARYVARDSVEKLIKGKLDHVDDAIARNGFKTVLLIRLIPNIIFDLQNLGLGLTKVRFKDYILATIIGIIPFSFCVVYFGDSFVNLMANPKNWMHFGIAILLLSSLYFLEFKHRKDQNIPHD